MKEINVKAITMKMLRIWKDRGSGLFIAELKEIF